MGTCKWCDNHGFFLFTDKDGLCKKCSFKIRTEANSKLRVIKNCNELVEKTKKIDTAISNAEVMIKYLSESLKYEMKGIEVYSSSIKDLLKEVINQIDEKMLLLVLQEYEIVKEKIELSKTKNAKIKQVDKFNAYSNKALEHIKLRQIANEPLQNKIFALQNSLLCLPEIRPCVQSDNS